MPFENIAPGILEFVDSYIDCFACWDVLVYFHENPEIERKSTGIASDIGRKIDAVEHTLETLVTRGLIEEEPDPEEEGYYRYKAPDEFRAKMDEFITATRDRTNRLAVVSRVLQKEAKHL